MFSANSVADLISMATNAYVCTDRRGRNQNSVKESFAKGASPPPKAKHLAIHVELQQKYQWMDLKREDCLPYCMHIFRLERK